MLKPITVGRAGLVVAILGEMTAPDAQLLAAMRRRGVNAVALVLGNPGLGAAERVGGFRTTVDTLRAADWRVVVVRRGDDLAAAWRRACNTGDGYSAAALRAPRIADRRPA